MILNLKKKKRRDNVCKCREGGGGKVPKEFNRQGGCSMGEKNCEERKKVAAGHTRSILVTHSK